MKYCNLTTRKITFIILLILLLAGCSKPSSSDLCPEGQTDCHGICVDLDNDPNNCGSCDTRCMEGEICREGNCLPNNNCTPPLENCGGICVDTRYNPNHCGGCNHKCGSGQACMNGICTGGECPSGQTNCPGYGCVDLRTNPDNCGSCGNKCSGACYNGECVGECPGGLTSCSGACVDLQKDENNCGSCGHACSEGEVCQAGTCVINCPPGFTNCSGECVDLTSDPDNCGSCGNKCEATQVCVSSTCSSEGCPSGLTNCGGICVDTSTDENNCGFCGRECPSGQTCVDGSCQVVCPEGQSLCDSTCVDTSSDESNCGHCGIRCRSDQICSGGTCICSGDLVECSGSCVDTSIDPNNCGTCGNRCVGSEACVDGTCTLACPEDLIACGGYCVDISSDRHNCGGCGIECAEDESCNGGTCVSSSVCPADSCSNPIDVSGGGRFTGSTECAGDDYSGSCGGTSGREVVFTFTIDSQKDVFISTYGSSFDTLLYIREGSCDIGTDTHCNDDEHDTLQSELKLLNLPAGTYYIFLDGYSSLSHGDYILDVYMTDPHRCWWGRVDGDRCGNPIFIDIYSATSITGNTCPWEWCDPEADAVGCRGTSDGKDFVYYFVVRASPLNVTFSLCDSASWDTVMYIRSVCNSSSSTDMVACNDDGCSTGLQSIITTTLEPGIYYLWIDGYSGSACGSFTLNITR